MGNRSLIVTYANIDRGALCKAKIEYAILMSLKVIILYDYLYSSTQPGLLGKLLCNFLKDSL